MPNNDYIFRSDALMAIQECFDKELKFSYDNAQSCMNRITAIPAADVEPKRKTGQWIDVYVSSPARMRTMCSECGMFSGIGGIPSNRYKPYCPNCGSPMLPEPPKEDPNAE